MNILKMENVNVGKYMTVYTQMENVNAELLILHHILNNQ